MVFLHKQMYKIEDEERKVSIVEAVPRITSYQFCQLVSWEIRCKQQWAVVGANGAGKSTLINILTNKYALKSGKVTYYDDEREEQHEFIKTVAFSDIYTLTDTKNVFYQQRWNVGLMQTGPIVRSLFPQDADSQWLSFLVNTFDVGHLLDKDIKLLSSGELRKILIIKSLINKPHILVLDNPYIGLDAPSRLVINNLFDDILKASDLQLILVLSNPADIPPFITHIMPVCNKEMTAPLQYNEFMQNDKWQQILFPVVDNYQFNFPKQALAGNSNYDIAIKMRQVQIRYGERTILDKLDWEVKKGEKWALLGRNGSGKSTLLSLVMGDNPQAYANDITLFDRKRGSGESIWDIKKRIGYVASEMHLYYLENILCLHIVASGFFDTIGLHRKNYSEQEAPALQWMRIFNIEHLKAIPFLSVSTGEQRLVLLARAFAKNPELLILDEPLHGLDKANKKRIKQLIEQFCDHSKTLIYVSHYEEEIPDVVNNRLVLEYK